MEGSSDQFPTLESVYKASGHEVLLSNENLVQEDLAWAQPVGGRVNLWETKNNMPSKSWLPQNSAWGIPKVTNKAADSDSSKNGGIMGNHHAAETFGRSFVSTQLSSWQEDNLKADDIDCNSSDSEIIYDSDDIDDYDSDSDDCNDSHEKRKKSKWFVSFFDSLDKLTVEDINSQSRQWHCPACQGGPGAIAWYQGLQSLIIHTKTKTIRRPQVHCIFYELLDEEVRRRGIFMAAINEALDRWEGLNESVKDYEIVWPPIVIIMNTRCERDDNGKVMGYSIFFLQDNLYGMGNQELLDYFSSYTALKARHSYGPQGHSGMSALIFEGSAAGYLEVLRLHKHFIEQGRDRNAWDCSRVTFCPGWKRQLYGYMAIKEDLDMFNQHSKGKTGLKFEMKSYQEMVESQIKHINDNNQRLTYLEEKFAQEQKQSKTLADSLRQVSLKLHQTTNQTEIVMQRIKLQHEQNKEELDAQEQFFKEQISIIYQAIELKEANFEELLRATRAKAAQTNTALQTEEDEHGSSGIQENTRAAALKDMEEFEQERERLMKSYQEKMSLITRNYWGERIELERELETRLSLLMERHTPTSSDKGETANGAGERGVGGD